MLCRLQKSIGLVVAGGLLVFGLIFTGTRAYADQPYEGGAYGDCAYSLGCDPVVVAPPTVIPVPPSPQNPQTGRAFSVNLHQGQQFGGSNYDIVVTPNFAVEQIRDVQIYLNGQLVVSSSKAQGRTFVLAWPLPKAGSYNLRVTMNLVDGGAINQQFGIAVMAKDQPIAAGAQVVASQSGGQQVGWLQNIINSTPRSVAYAMPYIFFLLLGSLLLVLLYQTRNQLAHIKALLALLRRDKELADEKANFIMLASHYIRTPLTVLAGAIELALMDNPTQLELLNSQKLVEGFRGQAEIILNSVQQNKDFKNIQEPDIQGAGNRLYRSWALLLPVGLSVVLVIGLNVLFLSAKRINLIIPNILLQVIIIGVLAAFLASLLQRRHQLYDEAQRASRQRDYQEILDQTRNQFIKLSADKLSPIVAQIKASFEQSSVLKVSPQISSATEQLQSLINRFVLVTQLERGKIERSLSRFDIEPALQQSLALFEPTIVAKKLRLTSRLSDFSLNQAKPLLQYAIRTLLDNAVKFSPDDGKVLVASAAHGRKAVRVTIRNQGQPIGAEKLERLFQPFSRGQSAEVANEGGAGLSLYLSRLIMRYLGGDVGLESDGVKTNTAKVILPRNAVDSRFSL